MTPRVGVMLSGCGFYDGAEIHEAVITMLALDRAGAKMILTAPNRPQMHVINHLTGEVAEGEARNVLVEAARIARGDIRDLKTITAEELDALVLPGGYGAAKNLCDFAVRGASCEVIPEAAELIQAMHRARKPIVALCIAPAAVMKVLAIGEVQPKLTIGTDRATAAALEKMGGQHEVHDFRGIAVDKKNKLISTPAYMVGKRISEVAVGIEKAIDELMKMLGAVR